jgi:GGDEF domain-containing protein
MNPINLDPNVDYLSQMDTQVTIPEWRKSLGAFGKETAAFGRGIQALGAHVLGMEETRDEALEAYQRNMDEAQSGWRTPTVSRVEDIKLGEEGGFGRLGDYVAFQLPKGLGNLATSLGGGLAGVGARIAAKGALKTVAKKGVQEIATDLATKTAARKGMANAALAGAGAASFGMEGGNLYGSLANDPEVGPEKAFMPALIGGAASAALDVVPEVIGAKALGVDNWIKTGLRTAIKKDPELASKAKGLARKIAEGVAVGAVTEGPTEGLQELVHIAAERWAKDDPMFAELDAEQKSAVLNSIIAGSLVGGVAGGTIGPFTQSEKITDGLQVQREGGIAEATPVQESTEQRETGGPRSIEKITEIPKILEDVVGGGQVTPTVTPQEAPQQSKILISENGRIIPTDRPAFESVQEAKQAAEAQELKDYVAVPYRGGYMLRPERRREANLRSRIEGLSPEEARKEIAQARRESFTDTNTGVGNRNAYEQVEKKPVQAFWDVDALGYLNTKFTEVEGGDVVLREVASVLDKHFGEDTFRWGGDEFVTQTDSETLQAKFDAAQKDFADATLVLTGTDGKEYEIQGLGVTLGYGSSLEEANVNLREEKAKREEAGLRARKGEAPPWLSERLASGGEGATSAVEVGQPENLVTQEISQSDTVSVIDAAINQVGEEEFAAQATQRKEQLRESLGRELEPLDEAVAIETTARNITKIPREPIGQEIPNAQQNTQAGQVYEDVSGTEPVRGQEVQVPTEEGGEGVREARQEGQVAPIEEVVETLRKKDGTAFGSAASAQRELNRRWNSGELQIEKGKEAGRQARARVTQERDGWVIQKLESRAPVWRSTLQEAAATVPQAKAQPQQWLGMLRKQPGVKEEEIEATGLSDWLEAQDGTVRKEDVEGFLQQGGVKVEEVVIEDTFVRDNERYEELLAIREYRGLTEAEQEEYLILKDRVMEGRGGTKYHDYQLPGGENYRELLVTIPRKYESNWSKLKKQFDEALARGESPHNNNVLMATLNEAKEQVQAGTFRSSHFSEPNILVHIRFNERTDTKGKRVLFMEEVQSDWHQKGRKEGYGIGVPDAPFKSSWPLLGMKRAIRWAAENGFDRVAWTPGEVQAERYDLSKQVGEVYYSESGLLMVYGRGDDRNTLLLRERVAEDKLGDYIGKEVANKLLDQKPNERGGLWGRRVVGDGLRIGGEGMKAFYDKMLPSALKKFAKKYGAKVGTTEIEAGGPKEVWSLDITPKLREEALQGMPLFSKPAAPVTQVSPIDFVADSDRILGQGWTQRALDAGLLQLNETSAPDAPSASYDTQSGITTLNLDKVPQGQGVAGVVAHELGSHAGMAHMLGQKVFDDFVGGLHKLANNGSTTAREAMRDSVRGLVAVAPTDSELGKIRQQLQEAGLTPKQESELLAKARSLLQESQAWALAEEDMAYYVQRATNETPQEVGFWNRLRKAIEAWFAGTKFGQGLIGLGWRPELSPQLAVSLARAGARNVVRQAEIAQQEVVQQERKLRELPEGWRQAVLDSATWTGAEQSLESRFEIPTRTGLSATIELDASPQTIKRVLTRETARAQREGDRFFEGVRILKDPRDGSLYVWPAKADLLHKDVATKLGIDTSLYNIVPVSGQAVDVAQVDEVLAEMPEDLTPLKKEFSFGEMVPQRTDVEPLVLESRVTDWVRHVLEPVTDSLMTPEEQPWRQSQWSKFQGWVQDQFNELTRKQKQITEARGEPLPESQMAREAEKASFGRKTKRVKDFELQYVNPMLRKLANAELTEEQKALVGSDKLTVEHADEAAYARHALEANRVGRLRQAKQFWKALRNDEEVSEDILKEMQQKKNYLWKKEQNKTTRREGLLRLLDEYVGYGSKELQDHWAEFREKPSGMSDREAAELNAKWQQIPAMQEVLELFDEMNRQVPGWYVADGMMTQDRANQWTNTYKHYATLQREGFEDQPGGVGTGYMAGKPSAIRQFSTRRATRPFVNSIWKAEKAIQRTENNKVGVALAKLILENPDPDFWTVAKHDKVPTLDQDGFLDYNSIKNIDRNQDTIFWENGEPVVIRAALGNQKAASIIRAMNNLESSKLGPIMRVMRKANRVMAAMNTSLSPEFFVTNPIRDFMTAQYNMSDSEADGLRKQITKSYLPAAKALRKVWRAESLGEPVDKTDEWSQWVDKYEKVGGRTGWMDLYENEEKRAKELERRLTNLSPGPGFSKSIHHIVRFVEDYNSVAENAIRLATFKALIEAKVPERRAVSIVKDLTMNFNQRGTASPAINALYMFAGAGIQGSARILAALKHPKVQKLVGATVALSVVVDQLNRAFDDDDEYDKLPEYVKSRNLVFVNPFGKGLITIPAPWGYNVVWQVGQKIGEMGSHAMGDLPEWSAWDSAADLASTTFDAFMPINGGTLLQTLSPTVFDPFVQIGENKDAFGRALKPEPFPGEIKPESEQYWRTVSDFSRKATEIVNEWTGGDKVVEGGISFSPEWLDAIGGQVFGSVGRQIKDMSELPFKLGTDDLELQQVPIARKLFTVGNAGQETARYYENVARIFTAQRQLEAYSEGPLKNSAAVQKLRQNNKQELGLVRQAEDVERQRKALRKSLNGAIARGDSRTEKVLRERITQLQQRFNESYTRRVGS